MSLRHKAREFALQMLFQWEMSPQEPAQLEGRFWKNARAADSTRALANRLFEGAAAEVPAVDALISTYAQNWRLERIAAIDRAILRLAIHELRAGETPPKVVLDEAIELAKTFSSEDASSFINGVLDAVRKSLAP
jgi:transcription antitermination protein NusB